MSPFAGVGVSTARTLCESLPAVYLQQQAVSVVPLLETVRSNRGLYRLKCLCREFATLCQMAHSQE